MCWTKFDELPLAVFITHQLVRK